MKKLRLNDVKQFSQDRSKCIAHSNSCQNPQGCPVLQVFTTWGSSHSPAWEEFSLSHPSLPLLPLPFSPFPLIASSMIVDPLQLWFLFSWGLIQRTWTFLSIPFFSKYLMHLPIALYPNSTFPNPETEWPSKMGEEVISSLLSAGRLWTPTD